MKTRHSRPSSTKILCVSPENKTAERLSHLLKPTTDISRESELDRLIDRLEREKFDGIVLRGLSTFGDAKETLAHLRILAYRAPEIPVLVLIGPDDLQEAAAVLSIGSCRYVKLPVTDEELKNLLQGMLSGKSERHIPPLHSHPVKFEKLLGVSESMREAFRQIRKAAESNVPVLIVGETGTGKELAAQAIHARSSRRQKPFVPVHLGALPVELIASELFGHEKGAFTGAHERRIGRFEEAQGGTVFLDEIATIDEKTQVSLLRLLEDRNFRRVGGKETIHGDVRLIAASNENLLDLARSGSFRMDLLFRLDVFRIVLPPLRDREGAVRMFADVFFQGFTREFGKDIRRIQPECLSLLETYEWPGNVRELKNVIQRAILVCDGKVLLPEHLPPRLRNISSSPPLISFPVGTPLAEMEKQMIQKTLALLGDNRKRTAERLGISRRSLYDKIRRYRISATPK